MLSKEVMIILVVVLILIALVALWYYRKSETEKVNNVRWTGGSGNSYSNTVF